MRSFQFVSVCFLLIALGCKTAKQTTIVTSSKLDLQAHRGGRGLMPENTIPAMKNAIDFGVTTLEMDVVISKDNKVVVSHDPYFNDVIATTPEGKFIPKKDVASYLLYTMPYDSIRKYDVGLKPHPDFPKQQKMTAYKPLLSDLVDAAEAYAKSKGHQIKYNIEIKSREGFDGIRHPTTDVFSELLIQILNDKKILNKTTVQSFDVRPLQYIHKKYPSITLSYLVERSNESVDGQLSKLGFVPNIFSPYYTTVNKEVVAQCHQKSMKIIPWTINTVEEMNNLAAMGVDGIISDYPDMFAKIKF